MLKLNENVRTFFKYSNNRFKINNHKSFKIN